MSEQIFLEGEELMSLVRETVAAGQKVRYLPFRGVSMLPMLRQGRDAVELAPLPDRLKKYDLPVYQLPSGKYVMHRVVDVKDDHYICNGDNLVEMERVYPHQMIALVSAFTRDGKRVEIDGPRYRAYCRFWCAVRPVRHAYRKISIRLKRRIKALLKRLFG